MAAQFPDVEVQLTGMDGNVFAIIGRVSSALKKAGHIEAGKEFANCAMDCGSYGEVLVLVDHYVEVR